MMFIEVKAIILLSDLTQHVRLSVTPTFGIKPTLPMLAVALLLTACEPTSAPTNTNAQGASQPASTITSPKLNGSNDKDSLVGCYTVSHSEPAQIKITKSGNDYAMQMRQFNNPKKDWDNPEPMKVIANDSKEISKYFDIKAGENKYLEKVIARPDRVFVLAKITDSFANLNPQYDSSYLGYIYKGSNTIYKVNCEQRTQL